jgi:hypothetical protein
MRVCELCGAEHEKRRFCSRVCSNRWTASHNRHPAINSKVYQKVCKRCQLEFEGTHNTKYCSNCQEDKRRESLIQLRELHIKKEKAEKLKNYTGYCIKCHKEIDGSFGSGKYCSRKCANFRVFTYESKKRISNTMIEKGILPPNAKRLNRTDDERKILREERSKIRKCANCSKEFVSPKINQQYCSIHCSASVATKKRWQIYRDHPELRPMGLMGGYRERSGYSKSWRKHTTWEGKTFLLQNSEEEQIGSVFDILKIPWNKNHSGFSYVDKLGKVRSYHPDFKAYEDIYVEYKGWLDKDGDMVYKMSTARDKNNMKLIIIYKYKEDALINEGLLASDVIKKPQILLEKINYYHNLM